MIIGIIPRWYKYSIIIPIIVIPIIMHPKIIPKHNSMVLLIIDLVVY